MSTSAEALGNPMGAMGQGMASTRATRKAPTPTTVGYGSAGRKAGPSPEATMELFVRYAEQHDERLREQLIHLHADLVERVARNFIASQEPLEDLVQEGYIGLVKAVDEFDPSMGNRFSTYATHKISGQIRHYLRDRKGLIREPGWLYELSYKITKAADQLHQRLNRNPTPAEIAAEANLAEEAVAEVLRTRSIFRVASLEAPESNGLEGEQEMSLDRRKIRSLRAETGQLPIEDKIVLHEALRKLKTLERRVVYALFYRELTQTEIASQLNISCNYVSHLVRTSLRRLRQVLASDELREDHLRLRSRLGERDRVVAAKRAASPLDETTRLLSARSFRERLEEELLRASRYGYEATIILFDIDYFSVFNEEHGFAQGDELLRAYAEKLRQTIRKVDVGARYEGGTFGLILPHTGERSKKAIADRLVQELSRVEVQVKGGRARATVSAGVATYPLDGSSKEELIRAAVEALHEAKQEGRNRARMARAA